MVSYLDIRITIVGQYVTAIYYYDKRDDFFFVLLIFHLCVVIIYLLYRLMAFLMGRICDHYEDFVRKNKEVTTRIIKHGFRFSKLCKCFKKFNIIFLVNIIQPLKDISKMVYAVLCVVSLCYPIRSVHR